MIGWLRILSREARMIFFFLPMLAIAAAVGFQAVKSQAADRLAQSPVSPVSSVPSPTAASDSVVLGLQNNLWFIAFIALVIVAIVGAILWLRSRPTGA